MIRNIKCKFITKNSVLILFYSYLKASIGFNLAAFLAGKYPKTTPIKVENIKDIKIVDETVQDTNIRHVLIN